MKSSKRKICQVLALAISSISASAAMAAGPLVQGGGSSLVAPTLGNISSTSTEIGLFGTSEATFTYYSVGSGAGQNAFLSNAPSFFGTGVTGTVDFANSDAALTTAQVTNYNNSTLGTTDGPVIEIPYIVTAITIPLINAPAVTSTATPQTTPGQAHSISLNDNDLCGIFSGKIKDWNAVINPETGSAYSTTSKPITVVYRADSSGTSELLTRHLANTNVCNSTNTATGVTFVDSLTFANTTAFPSGVPSNFVGATGSGGVRTALLALQSSSGAPAAAAYLSPDYANTFLAPSSSTASPALAVASLFNSKNSTYYAPTAANATTALGSIAPPSTAAAAADPTQWVPVSGTAYASLANPASGYPVSGTSQIIVSQCYASSAVSKAVVDFLTDHYTSASFASIVQGNGFNTVPSNFQTAIVANFLSNTSGNSLDIGDSQLCGTANLYPGR
ncbi:MULTISPECIES: substrate-binding domain-containing protein [Paraburkholderia]|uniref:substrate-binding domain-containing protein n=1 Tax=Paraburkholderia TaxID=1822464 RepID=UPI002253244B|nr:MULTISPECIES: substrate-binding domain-containing protein [Paraburkholderia]MCX4161666.1 substrate-binding domain-containing protein [Paraburkholderia megapolitana]MDN7157163.1 substrate-binding domain-containing protein [Paraburkholderia sp. CHISQ3]MDQ6494208.1 substrate-binding domain-containing protein [Paraburkholderia megapolitana]